MTGEGHVYFIRPVGMAGPIKIGFSKNPDERLRCLTAASPFPLEIAALVAGTPNLEAAIRRRFAFARSHCEWFHPVVELIGIVDRLVGGETLAQIIDLSPEITVVRKQRESRWRQALRTTDKPVEVA